MRLIVIQDGAMIADTSCGRDAPIYIGSSDACAIQLGDPRIAPQQAAVQPEAGGWVLEQLDATVPVHLNGSLVTSRMPLRVGDEIRVLEFLIRAYPPPEEARLDATSLSQLERFVQSKLPSSALIKKADEPLAILATQIHRVGHVNLHLSRCVTVEQVMDVTLRALLESFGAFRVWVGVRRVNYGAMEYVEGRFITGQPTDLPDIADAFKPRVLDRGQFIVVPLYSTEIRTSILTGPLAGPDGTLGMLYVDSGDTGRRFDARDLDYFMVLAHTCAVQLDAVFKEIATTRAATIEGQIAVAHEIQARLTPRKLPQWAELQFGAFREPGRERTGDIYDVVRLASGTAALMLAHTIASGPMPSMVMSQTQAAFRSAVMHLDAPNLFLRTLNWLLYDGQDDHPLGCFMAMIEPAQGQMRYALAGDIGAYVIGNRGEERRLGGPEKAAPLGLVRSASYALHTETIEPEETVVLFTPGVTTAKNRKGETFGEDRFVNILCDGFGQLASAMLKEMLSDLQHFTEGGQQPDDITVLLAHRV